MITSQPRQTLDRATSPPRPLQETLMGRRRHPARRAPAAIRRRTRRWRSCRRMRSHSFSPSSSRTRTPCERAATTLMEPNRNSSTYRQRGWRPATLRPRRRATMVAARPWGMAFSTRPSSTRWDATAGTAARSRPSAPCPSGGGGVARAAHRAHRSRPESSAPL